MFDQAARFLIKLDPEGFLRWLIAGIQSVLLFSRWRDTQTIPFPGEPDRRCDTVAELASAEGTGPPWLLVLELQTRPDPDIAERLLEYLARLRRELRHGPHGNDKYPSAAAVLNLTGNPSPGELEMLLPAGTGIGLHWRMVSKSLAAESAAATLEAIAAGQQSLCLLPWVPLMAGGGEPEVLTRWKELASGEPSQRRRAEYGKLALVFAELGKCLPQWEQSLEGWAVEVSQVVLRWQAQARLEGLQQGVQQGLQDALRLLLEQRFPGTLPEDILARIQGTTDLARLRHGLSVAVTATSLDQVRAALGG